MNQVKILIADDDPVVHESLGIYLKAEGYIPISVYDGKAALENATSDISLFVLDIMMPQLSGIDVCKEIRKTSQVPIIMLTAKGEEIDRIIGLELGADDYIVKPFDPEELVIRLKKLVEAQHLRNLVESETRNNTDEDKQIFVGESSSIKRIKEVIGKISDTNSTVLITGESGTGKEVVAREIHASSPVKEGPFVAINIGGVPENLLESELFGYEKGAFTGAVSRKTGMFELASGGTLFLDEIGDMPLSLQVKILRVLQDRKITRLGGTAAMPINARIIAATNKDLEQRVRDGVFREDLFYRLNVVRIVIPPLRERREDIPLLAAGILKRLNRQMGHKVTGFSADALALLCSHEFYGNVRELENILERAVIFSSGDEIQSDDLDLRGSVSLHTQSKEEPKLSDAEAKSLKDVEIDAIIRALHRWEGNRTRAAEELGISRRTLINKIAEYDLHL